MRAHQLLVVVHPDGRVLTGSLHTLPLPRDCVHVRPGVARLWVAYADDEHGQPTGRPLAVGRTHDHAVQTATVATTQLLPGRRRHPV